MIRTSASSLLRLLVILSVSVGICQAYLFSHGAVTDSRPAVLWGLMFSLILAMWVEADSRSRPEIYRPHSLGFFVMFFWLAYLPYYLVRTRKLAGVLLLLGFLSLYLLGALISLGVAVVS